MNSSMQVSVSIFSLSSILFVQIKLLKVDDLIICIHSTKYTNEIHNKNTMLSYVMLLKNL